MSNMYKKYIDKAKKKSQENNDSKSKQDKEYKELYQKYNLKYAMGTPSVAAVPASQAAPMNNSSANTASSLSPLLKATYAGKKMKKYADGGEVKDDSKTPDLGVIDEVNMYKHDMDVTNDEDRQKYKNMKQLKSETNLPMFSDGGQIQESQQQKYQAKDYFGKDDGSDAGDLGRMSNGGPVYSKSQYKNEDFSAKGLNKFAGNTPHYDQGTTDSESSFFDSVRKAFNAPQPSPTPDPDSLEEKYKKIRQDNADRASGKASTVDEKIYNEGTPNVKDNDYALYNNPDKLDPLKGKQTKGEMLHEPRNAMEYNNPDMDESIHRPMTDMEQNNPSKYDEGTSGVDSAQESMRKAFHFDGGTPNVPPIDPAKAQQISDSFKSAFHFARGTSHVPAHEAYHKYLSLFGGLPKVPTIPKNSLATVKAPAEVKIPLSIERAPHLKIPKRLKPVSSIKGYDEGTDEVPADDSDDAMVQKYRKLGLLKGPTVKTNDVAEITGSPTPPSQDIPDSGPAKESDVEESQDAGDKELENKMANEDFEASEDADKLAKDEDKSDREPASEDDEESDDKDEKEADKTQNASDESPDKEVEDAKEVLNNSSPTPDDNSPAQKLLDAQSQQRNSLLFNQLGKITDKMGASMGHFQAQNQDIYDENMKNADLPVKQLEQQIAMEKYDPNSGTSKAFRQYLQKFGGPDVASLGNISAAQAETIAPMAFKQFEAQQAQQARSADTKARTDERLQQTQLIVDQRREQAQEHQDTLRMMNADKAERAASSKADKDSAAKVKAEATSAQQADQSLFGFRQPPEIKQARMDFYNSQKGLNTIGAFEKLPGGLNSMDPNMVGNVRTEVQKIAQSGAPTEGGINKFDPQTWSGKLAEVWQKVSNKPTGANAAAFLKEYKDYLSTMQDTAGPAVNAYNQTILGNKKRTMNEDDYNQRLNSEYVAPFLKYEKGKSAKPDNSQQPSNNTQPPSSLAPNEVKRVTKDGRTAIFDSNTKKFLRYE